MLKPLLAPMAAAIALAVPMTAHAAPAPDDDVSGSHWYIGVSVGGGNGHSTSTRQYLNYPYQETITSTSTGAAFRLFGGWRYANSRGDSIGIGITDTAVSLGDSSTAGIVGLDLNTKLHLVGPWFLSARVGGYSGRSFNFYRDYYNNYSYTYSDAQDGTYYGIGTGIDFNDSNSLSISWDRYLIADYTDTTYSPAEKVSDTYLDVYLLSYTYTF